MESLQVRTGTISLRILDDEGEERGIFKFNPEDIESAKRVVALQKEVVIKQQELEDRVKMCESDEDKVAFLSETVQYFRGVVDQCFGDGTSQIVFGDACTLTMFTDFFDGITPYYQKASKQRMSKYSKAKPAKK